MKLNYKKLSIFSLVGLFLISALLCCCFTNVVKAEEPTPSCHQMAQEADEPSKDTQECECEDSVATLKEAVTLKTSIIQISILSLDQLSIGIINNFKKVDAYQAPPSVYNISPLYIKYSILRI